MDGRSYIKFDVVLPATIIKIATTNAIVRKLKKEFLPSFFCFISANYILK